VALLLEPGRAGRRALSVALLVLAQPVRPALLR
jgi:hypothetical protein